MDLSRLLPPSHIIMNLRGTTPEEIIRTLAHPLAAEGIISDMDEFVRKVLEREQVFTTQIVPDIAIPHAHAEQIRAISLVIGLTGAEGIPFADNTPGRCRLFFLIAIPASQPEAHLELMANLVELVMFNKLDRLLNAPAAEDVLKLLLEH